MEPAECEHPFDKVGFTMVNLRGSTAVVKATCNTCGKPLADGMLRVVSGLKDEIPRLRRAICNLGGAISDTPMIKPRKAIPKKDECQHYLGWLDIQGQVAGRGHNENASARCRNCGTSWPGYVEVIATVKLAIENMWREIQRLGGTRVP